MLNLALSDTFLKCLPENYLDHVRAIHGYFGKSAKRKAELKGLSVALRHELAALAQSVDDADVDETAWRDVVPASFCATRCSCWQQ